MAIKHRIEIKFAGAAPDDEMARAKIIASQAVQDAIDNLSSQLDIVGLPHEVTAQTIRSTDVPRKPKRHLRAAE